MALKPSLLPPFKLEKKRKSTLLSPKSSNKGSAVTFILILLEKRVPKGTGKLSAESILKLAKGFYILY